MAAKYKVGLITVPGSTGAQAISGLGFEPTGLILVGTHLSGTQDNLQWMFGMTDGATHRVQYTYLKDGEDPPSYAGNTATDKVILFASNSTTLLDASLTSFDADGFTLNWATVTSGYQVIYVAFSDDITIKVGSFATGTSTGSQGVTGVGFDPTGIIFAPFWWENFGFATEANDFGTAGANNTAVGQHKGWQSTTYSILTARGNADGIRVSASLTSFDADGFTIEKASATNDTTVFYMAFAGITIKVGTLTQPTSNGSQVITGVGFSPGLVLFGSFGGAASGSALTDTTLEFGAADSGLANKTVSWLSDDSATPTDMRTVHSDNCICSRDPANGSVKTAASLIGTNGDGFTLLWTATDATQREIGYIAFEGSASFASKGLMLLGVG